MSAEEFYRRQHPVWTPEMPKAEGWYWWRNGGPSGMGVQILPVDDITKPPRTGGEWSGPIIEPAEGV